MMKYAKLPKSLKKYVRMEKARIRRGNIGVAEENAAIVKMYEKVEAARPQPST